MFNLPAKVVKDLNWQSSWKELSERVFKIHNWFLKTSAAEQCSCNGGGVSMQTFCCGALTGQEKRSSLIPQEGVERRLQDGGGERRGMRFESSVNKLEEEGGVSQLSLMTWIHTCMRLTEEILSAALAWSKVRRGHVIPLPSPLLLYKPARSFSSCWTAVCYKLREACWYHLQQDWNQV